ncbi:MAG: glycosyltransferase [Nostoc sp.]
MKKHLSQSLPIVPSRKLKITILTVGSRGDLQPYCALAIGLKRAGHEVTIATHENFELFVRKFDLEFAPIAGNMEEFLQSKQGQRLIAGEKLKKEEGDKLLLQQLESAWSACVGSEVIIYTPLATFGYHIAEKLGVPCFFASVLPLSPTGMFGFLRFAQTTKNPLKKAINYGSYLLVEFLHWLKISSTAQSLQNRNIEIAALTIFGQTLQTEDSGECITNPCIVWI